MLVSRKEGLSFLVLLFCCSAVQRKADNVKVLFDNVKVLFKKTTFLKKTRFLFICFKKGLFQEQEEKGCLFQEPLKEMVLFFFCLFQEPLKEKGCRSKKRAAAQRKEKGCRSLPLAAARCRSLPLKEKKRKEKKRKEKKRRPGFVSETQTNN